MEIIYSEEDQKKINSINKTIAEYESLLMSNIKAMTSDEREILRQFIGDSHRRQLYRSKATIMQGVIPKVVMSK